MTEAYPIGTSATAAKYTYYAVDIVSNKILAQIPFEDVIYERTLKGAGSFDGKISINKQTKDLDLYNSTLPGKCALYVVRNGVCMWGGIIWGRTYDLFGRSLNVTASEFTSYLKHRIIWKTYSYQFTAVVNKTSKKLPAKVVLQNTSNINLKIPIKVLDDYGNLNRVYVSFTRSDLIKYNGYYPLSPSVTPTTTVFYITIPDLPAEKYTDVSISIRVDTYEYLKELMKEAAQDFVDSKFANEVITPGIRIPYQITNKSADGGIVTLTTSTTHDLVPGQNVEIRNVDENVDGVRLVSETPSSNTFRVIVPAYNIKTLSASANTATVTVDVGDTNDIFKLTVGSRVTIADAPTFGGYNYFNFSNVKILSVSNNNTFTYEIVNPRGTIAISNATSTDSLITYTATNTLSVGDYVTVKNSNNSSYNVVNKIVTYADSTKFIIANPLNSAISGKYSPYTATAYAGINTISGVPGVVSQISIPPTNIYTNKYEVATRALKPTKPYGVVSAKRSYNSDKSLFIVTLQLGKSSSKTFTFLKGDTITTSLAGDTTKDANKNLMYTALTNGDGGGVVLTAVDKVKKTVSYELTGVATKKDDDTYISEQTTFTTLSGTNTINYATATTEVEIGISEEAPLRKDMYVYVTGVDGVSWSQPLYNGFQQITDTSVIDSETGSISTKITKYATEAGVATLYTSKNNSFVNDQMVTIAGFAGSLSYLNGVFKIIDSIQGSLDGESYFTYYIDDNASIARTVADNGVTGRVKGQNVFRYKLPEYGPINEPDGKYAVTSYRIGGYASDATDKRSTVRIKTQEKIKFNPGDSVDIAIGVDATDGSYKVGSVSPSRDSFTYKIPASKSSVSKSTDSTYKTITGTVSRTSAQLDQQSLKYQPTISAMSCESNVVTVRSVNHQFNADDSISLIFPSAFQDYDNNGFKVIIQSADKDTFTYSLTNFRDGVTTAADAGVVSISKYKFTKNTANNTSGTIRYTTTDEHYYTVGSKVTVTKINKNPTGTAFAQSLTWSSVYVITEVNDLADSVKYFEVSVTNLTNAADITEQTLASNLYGKAVSTAMMISKAKALTSGSASSTQITYTGTNLPFVADETLTVVGFTGTGSTRINSKGKITSTAGTPTTSVKIDVAGTVVSPAITSGKPFGYVRSYASALLDYSESITAQTVYGISAVASTKTITLYCPDHGFVDQDVIKLVLPNNYKNYYPSDDKPVTISKIDNSTFSYKVTNTISNIAMSETITDIGTNSGTVRFTANNSFSAGQKITIKGVIPDVYNFTSATVTNATATYFEIASTETASYEASNGVAMQALSPTGTAVEAPYVAITPVVLSRTYGEFPKNTNIGGLDFDGTTYSGNFYPNTIVRGSDMVTLDAHMEQYSNSVNGFNYRIDCTLNNSGGESMFKRKFVLVPITPATLKEYLNTQPGGVLPVGKVAPPYAFGADKITFEHPGNVENVSFSESAENAATRMFVSGNNGAGDPNSVARFSGAADNDLLEAGWPILDRAEKIDWPTQYNPLVITVNRDNWGNYDAEADFYATAKRFLYQSRPPQGDFVIRVNGSLPPVIGSYNPGDWCQLIVDDEAGFINSRLASVLEPRKDVILRRIDNIKISVPNSPAFPEEIDLTLVTDWEVDRIGK
jgi:hypothetical protein